jgi:hypothetical protein
MLDEPLDGDRIRSGRTQGPPRVSPDVADDPGTGRVSGVSKTPHHELEEEKP